ncbi:MAG TPA: 7-carboxy-7-deazaguanine synthase QueE [Actinoplanes sp.]|nr:7-carboxy-7-deazaguanine synthase QueE [Actinoplanes sp.]
MCAFLRLGGCNLSCHWCDTPYTWDWTGKSDSGIAYDPRKELHRTPVGELLDRLLAFPVPLIVISGGEPLSQQRRLVPLVEGLVAAGRRVEFETNGTIAPAPEIRLAGVRFNVSPKLRHGGDPMHKRIKPEALRSLNATPDVAFKFVCQDESDLDEVAVLAEQYGLAPIWIMPKGDDVASVLGGLSALAPAVVERGWNLSSRMHVLVWGGTRGV